MENNRKDHDSIILIDPITQYHIAPVTAEESFLSLGLRDHELLNGRWHFSVDVYNTFLRKQLFLEPSTDAYGKLAPVDYDYEQWEKVNLPSNWNCEKEKYWHYEGTGIYTRTFPYEPKAQGERVFLRIGAANYMCRVWLNGTLIARHTGGFTPFAMEITGKLKLDNRIILEVDSTRRIEQVPSLNYDWFNYGGVYRDIELVRMPKTFIRDAFVSLDPQNDAIDVRVMVDGNAAGVRVRIAELDIDMDIPVDAQGKAQGSIDISPELWSPENPKLYRVLITCDGDSWQDDIGFRRIEARGKDIYLNGNKLFLKGICCHEEAPNRGHALTQEDMMKTLSDAKALGCNIVRLAHYPHDEQMSRLADRMGILLWEEVPVYWALRFDAEETLASAQNQMRELIMRDRNRASVILWSVGNENPDTQARLDFMKSLISICKELDPTRLTTAACLVNGEQKCVSDRLCEYVDVISINEYYGWYISEFDELRQILENSQFDKPLMISETGAGAKSGHHGVQGEFFTEEHQAYVYRKQIEITDGKLAGFLPWILYDFNTPLRMNAFQEGYNRKGLIDETRSHRKLAWHVMHDYYMNR